MITDTFSHNIDNLQSIGYSYNYTLKSALLPYANTQSPDVTECNQSYWPEYFYEPVSLIHAQYTSAVGVSVQ